jgi:uncharacterized protein YjdB
LLSLASAVAVGALGARCSSVKATDGGGDAVNGAASVEVTVTPSTVRAGETATVSVRVTNTSAAAKTLQFTSSCLTSYEFLDADGNVVGLF